MYAQLPSTEKKRKMTVGYGVRSNGGSMRLRRSAPLEFDANVGGYKKSIAQNRYKFEERLAQRKHDELQKAAATRRKEQGRETIDRWDTLANFVTTHWEFLASDPDQFDLVSICNILVEEVNSVTGLPKPTRVKIVDVDGHASTSGGWYERNGEFTNKQDIVIKFKKYYVERALREVKDEMNTDRFRKLIRTTSHEMTHVKQRLDENIIRHTTKAQREVEAYGSELTKHYGLPSLWGKEFEHTKKKFTNQYDFDENPSVEHRGLKTLVDGLCGRGVGK